MTPTCTCGAEGIHGHELSCPARSTLRSAGSHDVEAPQQWRTEFVTTRGEPWCGNALVYDTPGEAEEAARSKAFAWTIVRLARVVPTSTPTRQPCDYDAPGPVVVDYR